VARGVLRTYLLPDGDTVIGRDPGCAIFLDDPTVSSEHAKIRFTDNGFTLQDLGSKNGTSLAGETLPQGPSLEFPLEAGDRFQIGSYTLIFKAGTPPVEQEESDEQPSGQRQVAPLAVTAEQPVKRFYPYVGEMPPGVARYSLALLPYLPELYQPPDPFPAEHNDPTAPPDESPETFLSRFLALFESVFLPIEWVIENFDFYLDPRTAPLEFFPWLESWYGLSDTANLSEVQRRELLCHACDLYNRKGTRAALVQIIELYTGCTPVIDDLTTAGATFLVTMKAERGRQLDDKLVKRLIDAFKPVHTTYKLTIQ
jgi:phage tail-like protein